MSASRRRKPLTTAEAVDDLRVAVRELIDVVLCEVMPHLGRAFCVLCGRWYRGDGTEDMCDSCLLFAERFPDGALYTEVRAAFEIEQAVAK